MAEARSSVDLPRAPQGIRRRSGDGRHDRGGKQAEGRSSDRGLQGLTSSPCGVINQGRLCGWRVGVAELTYRDAVARGIAQEMARDDRVVFLGEDVAKAGGVFKATVGLLEQFGPLRVRDTPISEQAIMGAAMGAAMTGLKPIAE